MTVGEIKVSRGQWRGDLIVKEDVVLVLAGVAVAELPANTVTIVGVGGESLNEWKGASVVFL